MQIEASVGRFAGPIGLTVPAPAGSAIGDLYLLVRNRTVTIGGPLADIDRLTGVPRDENPTRTVERLEIIETATVKDNGGYSQACGHRALALSPEDADFPRGGRAIRPPLPQSQGKDDLHADPPLGQARASGLAPFS